MAALSSVWIRGSEAAAQDILLGVGSCCLYSPWDSRNPVSSYECTVVLWAFLALRSGTDGAQSPMTFRRH